MYLLTLGAFVQGLQYSVCVCVCVTNLLAPYQVYNVFSMAIGFSLGVLDFQLTDLSKMSSFLKRSAFHGYFVVCNPHKRFLSSCNAGKQQISLSGCVTSRRVVLQ